PPVHHLPTRFRALALFSRRLPERGLDHRSRRLKTCTKGDLSRCSKRASLLDDLIGEGEQLWRDFQAERLGSFAIKNELELIYLLDRQLSGFNPLENATHVNAAFVIAIPEHRSIAHQATDFGILADFVERRNCVSRRQRDEMLAPAVEERVG